MLHIYNKSNPNDAERIVLRWSELSDEKFVSQFKGIFSVKLSKLKNDMKTLWNIAKGHEDKSVLTNHEVWPSQINSCLNDAMEVLKDIYVVAQFFPTVISLYLWACEPLIILSNYYFLIKLHKTEVWDHYWKPTINPKWEFVKKILFKTIIKLLKRLYFGVINNWGTGAIQKKNELSDYISKFIMQMVGKQTIDRDIVHPNWSIIDQRGGWVGLFRKILKVVEFEPYLYMIDDDILKNREELIEILTRVLPHEMRNTGITHHQKSNKEKDSYEK